MRLLKRTFCVVLGGISLLEGLHKRDSQFQPLRVNERSTPLRSLKVALAVNTAIVLAPPFAVPVHAHVMLGHHLFTRLGRDRTDVAHGSSVSNRVFAVEAVPDAHSFNRRGRHEREIASSAFKRSPVHKRFQVSL
jgi:hypothetical protein